MYELLEIMPPLLHLFWETAGRNSKQNKVGINRKSLVFPLLPIEDTLFKREK